MVIANRQGQIELIPIQRRQPGHELTQEARDTLIRIFEVSTGTFAHAVAVLQLQGSPVLQVGGEYLFGDSPATGRRVLQELTKEPEPYLVRQEGQLYVLTPKGERTAKDLVERRRGTKYEEGANLSQ